MAYHFNNRIEFVDFVQSGPEVGGEEITMAKAWADIRTMQGGEYNFATLAGNTGQSRFIIRHQNGIKPHWQIKFKGLHYKIESIVNDNEENRTITLVGEAIL